jgi:hypothetical protein
MTLLEQYKEEIAKDLIIDDFNIKEVQLRLPSRKHFWAARLIDAKITQNDLIKKKKKLKAILTEKIIHESPVSLSKPTVDKMVEERNELIKLNNKIEEYNIIILYLEKVEKIFSTMHWEIRNITELVRMEQL